MEVTSKIPPPERRTRNSKYPFPRMQINDSFAFTEPKIRAAAYQHGHRHRKKFICHVEDDGYRCWRVA